MLNADEHCAAVRRPGQACDLALLRANHEAPDVARIQGICGEHLVVAHAGKVARVGGICRPSGSRGCPLVVERECRPVRIEHVRVP